jgi:hypothetical protein
MSYMLTHGQAVYRVATPTVDFDDVPQAHLKPCISPLGRPYFRIDSVINISMQSSLEFFVTVRGKKYGSLIVQYD